MVSWHHLTCPLQSQGSLKLTYSSSLLYIPRASLVWFWSESTWNFSLAILSKSLERWRWTCKMYDDWALGSWNIQYFHILPLEHRKMPAPTELWTPASSTPITSNNWTLESKRKTTAIYCPLFLVSAPFLRSLGFLKCPAARVGIHVLTEWALCSLGGKKLLLGTRNPSIYLINCI